MIEHKINRQPNTQDLSWFLDLNRQGSLDLNPSYQRNSVWNAKDRKFFLDTIFKNFPCPPIFVHKSIDDQGVSKYHIVDGKQRIQTILLFVANKIALDKNFGDSRYNNKRWKALDSNQKRDFWNYRFTVETIDLSDGGLVNEVFDRVNRNSKNLERQELRHARYNGWFITFAENEAEKNVWKDLKISSDAKAKRMKDVQFISELMLIILENKIVGFSQDYLDHCYSFYDKFDDSDAPQEEADEAMDTDSADIADETSPAIFDDMSQSYSSIMMNAEEFEETFSKIRQYIIEMDNTNGCIKQYARIGKHFYTLWATIALHHDALSSASELAVKYEKFMQMVETYSKNPEDTLAESNVLEYAESSKGASTEFPQRQKRQTALDSVLLGER
jgi:hypothetical protein